MGALRTLFAECTAAGTLRGIADAIGNLANHCMLATLGQDSGASGSQRSSATATFNNTAGRLGVTIGSGRDTLPGWL